MASIRLNPDPPQSAFIRSLICHALAGGPAGAREIAATSCRSTPQVAEFFAKGGFDREEDLRAQFHRKGGVAAGSLGGSHWLDDMAVYSIAAEGFQILQSRSIALRLWLDSRRVDFRSTTTREYGAGAGSAWRGEGLPTPIMQTTVDALLQGVYESSTVFVVTREALRFGKVAETMLRKIVAAAVAKWIDQQFLDPSVSATSARPASITYGAATVTSSGSTAANIVSDLASLIAAIQSPGDTLRWLLKPTTLAFVNARLASVGLPPTPGYLLGIPVIAGSTSPAQIALVDAESILVSYDEAMTVDISTATSIQQDTAPTMSAISGAGAATVSMFQVGAVAIKATLDVAWQSAAENVGSPAQQAGVAVMAVSY